MRCFPGYLAPHTDGTFTYDQVGVLVLHSVKHDGAGGETILVDGFQIAKKIKQNHPEAFERLCKTVFESGFKEPGVRYLHAAPFFIRDEISGEISQIRYNHSHRSPVAHSPNVRQYYEDLQLLTKYVDDPANRLVFKLKPGVVAIIDNWRLMHGRTAYTGLRYLVGCYIGRDEFQSVARYNGLI